MLKFVCILLAGVAVAVVKAKPDSLEDPPVELVVMTTNALKAFGVIMKGETFLKTEKGGEEPDPAVNYAHHKFRHFRRRYRVFKKCPRGMKKDVLGNCRRIWGF